MTLCKFYTSIRTLLFYGFFTVIATAASGNSSFGLKGNVTIYTSAKPGEPVYRAVIALQKDMTKVLGGKTIIKDLTDISKPGIIIINSQKDDLIAPLYGREAHQVSVKKIGNHKQVILQGADMRGTIYAIYTFSQEVLGVPPLWFFSSWSPHKRKKIRIPDTLRIQYGSPYVKYRAWFPNDMDLLNRWRKLSKENDEIWIETALRLKLNTMQWVGESWNGVSGRIDYSREYSVAPTTKLISDFGMINTTHHAASLYSYLRDWDAYWTLARHTTPPSLSLANEDKLQEFWRYNIECVQRNKIDMLWEVGFRGAGDAPFWYTFRDAPASMMERGEIISRMLKKQLDLLTEVTKDSQIKATIVFYDEMSDLLGKGYIHPPVGDSNLIWTFVAARRDPYPERDLRELDPKRGLDLGYYYNMQFTSTGAHLVEAGGPWNMERNFRYVDSKSGRPLRFSVVNAGNIREFLLSLSANAQMMWDLNNYDTDEFLLRYCTLYFGKKEAARIAKLYHDYFYAYWRSKKPDLAGFDRQYLYQDLRLKRTIAEVCRVFERKFDPNPMKDYGGERVKGRTYRIVPEDNGAANQVDAIINGTTQSVDKFFAVVNGCDQVYDQLTGSSKIFFNDNLRAPAYFMYYLSKSLLKLCKAYKLSDNDARKNDWLNESVEALKDAKEALQTKAHGPFKEWYAGDTVFGMDHLYKTLDNLRKRRIK